jgi:hypothetical protein
MFTLLLFFTAVGISAVAAYFSIVGLISIFTASPIAIAIMGGSLEIGKLVTASFLYRYWYSIHITLRIYFTTTVVILSIITSLGIFGYLSQSHSGSGVDYVTNTTRIDNLNERLSIEKNRLAILLKQSEGYAQPNQKLERQITESQNKIEVLTKEILPLREAKNKGNAEIGAIRYVAELVYGKNDFDTIEKSVQWIIIVLICVFDPLAILLLIAANHTLRITNSGVTTIEPIAMDEEKLKSVTKFGD